jgi:D-3-phosphoglycerate dehydrogenase / 2-oxoglutarate reductase
VPGVLASINRLLADAGANVVGQSLHTRGELGYVVTDTDLPVPDATLAALRQAPEAVWLRTWTS